MSVNPGRWRVPCLLLAAMLAACASESPAELRDRPNVLLVVADDLGFSDISPFGSEIRTPTLSALADTGLIATSFYVSPRGASTRAMLLTGVDHHMTGFGGVPGRLQAGDAAGSQDHSLDYTASTDGEEALGAAPAQGSGEQATAQQAAGGQAAGEQGSSAELAAAWRAERQAKQARAQALPVLQPR